jgi:hypothetical protein
MECKEEDSQSLDCQGQTNQIVEECNSVSLSNKDEDPLLFGAPKSVWEKICESDLEDLLFPNNNCSNYRPDLDNRMIEGKYPDHYRLDCVSDAEPSHYLLDGDPLMTRHFDNNEYVHHTSARK